MPPKGWSSICVPEDLLKLIKELIDKKAIRGFNNPSSYAVYIIRKDIDTVRKRNDQDSSGNKKRV